MINRRDVNGWEGEQHEMQSRSIGYQDNPLGHHMVECVELAEI
jgi:hypothetical protein